MKFPAFHVYAFLLAATAAQGATITFTNAVDSDITNNSNWSGGSPTLGGSAADRWNLNGTTEYTTAQGTTELTGANRSLVLANGNGSTGELTVTGGTLQLNGNDPSLIGTPGSTGTANGTLNLSGGNVEVAGEMQILPRGGASASGTLNINSGSTLTADILAFGGLGTSSGTGTLNINSGGVLASRVLFERTEISDQVNVDGGTLRAIEGTNPTNKDWIRSNLDDFNILAGGMTLDSNGQANKLVSANMKGTAGGNVSITESASGGSVIFATDQAYDGATTIDAGATLILGNNGTSGTLGTGAFTNNGTLGINRSDDLTQSAMGAVAPIDGGLSSGSLLKQGDGKLTLDITNTYSGTTTISGGILEVTHADALQNSSDVTVNVGGALEVNGGINLAKDTTISGEGIGFRGAISGGTTAGNEYSGNITVAANYSRIGTVDGGNLIVSGDVGDGGAGHSFSFRTGDAGGSITVSGNNTYGGATRLYGGGDDTGVITIGSATAIPNGSLLETSRGTVDTNGFNLNIGGLTGWAGTGSTITNNGAANVTIVSTLAAAESRSFDGNIIDGVSAIFYEIAGEGTQSLSGVNTYSGDTTVGTDATLNLDGTQTFFIDGLTSNSILGDGTVNLNGIFSFNLVAADLTDGNMWSIIDTSLTETYGLGFDVTGFTETAGVWEFTDGANEWTFTESTGVLALEVIPEPSSLVLLLLSGAAMFRRKKR